ncbi:MAG: type II secretion system F family protein [Candidatus Micrarchaeota archaeon]|nr:type II secretion system F family protein [Candidatus Micrarchaeota archaeon]
MAIFGGKKKAEKEENKGPILGFTKPKRFLFFKIKSKPIYSNPGPAQQPPSAPQPQTQPRPQIRSAPEPPKPQAGSPRQMPKMPSLWPRKPEAGPQAQPSAQQAQRPPSLGLQHPAGRPNQFQIYLMSVAERHKDLEAALRAEGIKESPYEFVRKMFMYSVIVSVVIALCTGILLASNGVTPILALLLGVACYYGLFNRFIRYPLDRSKVVGKEIEKDILFAARDLVISMRSGMPLFNAITAVSTGYGAASLEFAKVVELVQLGTPIEQALDEVSNRSQSKTFKRITLQATVSLKAGADVVGALQGVVDEVMQERVIELRRYGQRLNALAMFYMLFGVIFPSMGIAVAAILTTFINLFTVDESTLLAALIGIFFLQVIFLNIMRSSRPTFAM